MDQTKAVLAVVDNVLGPGTALNVDEHIGCGGREGRDRLKNMFGFP